MSMPKTIQYRHEFKYIIQANQLAMLRMRLTSLMQRDKHVNESGGYNIRSLYFDDYRDSCLYENLSGADPRRKYRIRIYDHSAERISLECKHKERGKTRKESCLLTQEQTRLLMAGKPLPDITSLPPLARKFTVEMLQNRLRPVVIVEYDRIPFVNKAGNVRVTLDMNISSSKSIEAFLDETIPKRPIMPRGQHLMEVKFDEFLPDFIHHSLQLHSLAQTAFSKYILCRKYTNNTMA